MDETQQINLCIDEMAKLKEKMEALEKQKILNKKNEMLKKTTMEPNLKVLEDWLNDYHEAIEEKIEKINKEATEEDKNNIIIYIKCKVSLINYNYKFYQEGAEEQNYERFDKYKNVDLNELEQMTLSLETEPYNVLKDKCDKIKQIYDTGNYIEPPQSKEEIAASHIEATYNMFNIINKRLDDIEKKLGINN
tara:strand:- start:1999 stop:2574 length:576 start_codon:yes stop_codon:yes gene_type:complete